MRHRSTTSMVTPPLFLFILVSIILCAPLWAGEVHTNIGSYEVPPALEATDQIDCSTAVRHRTIAVQGNTTPVLLISDPPILPGTSAGQRCTVCGADPINTVTLTDGNGLALSRTGMTLVLKGPDTPSPGTCADLVWTGTLWRQLGPAQDIGEGYILNPPPDQDVTITTSGIGALRHNGAPVRSGAITLQSSFAEGDGRLGPVDTIKPFVITGETLEYRTWEQGGNGFSGWFDGAGNQISPGWNVPPGGVSTIYGDGIPIVSYDADTAALTTHGVHNYCADAGSTDTYACSMTPVLDRYVTGGLYFFKANTANTGAATINFNALGAITIKKVQGGITTDLANNDILVGQVVAVQYDGTNMQMQSPLGNVASGSGPSAPLRPYSAIPATAGLTFGCIIDGDELMCVPDATTLNANATWQLGFQMPTTSWSCTWSLIVDVKTTPTSGVVKINPSWAAWAVGAVRPTSLTAETVTADSVTGASASTTTITFDGPANELVRAKWTLNATTLPTTGQRVAMNLVVEDSGTTVAGTVGMTPYLVCE